MKSILTLSTLVVAGIFACEKSKEKDFKKTPEASHSSARYGQVYLNSGYDKCFHNSCASNNQSLWIYFDPAYLEILRERSQAAQTAAEAELVKAKAEAAVNREKINQLQMAIAKLQSDRTKMTAKLKAYADQQKFLNKAFRASREVTHSFSKTSVKSMQFILALDHSSASILKKKISPIAKDQFTLTTSASAFVDNGDGTSSFRKPEIQEFKGGTLADYLTLLLKSHQKPSGEQATTPLREAKEHVATFSTKMNQNYQDKVDSIHQKMDANWKESLDLIKTFLKS